MLSRGYLQPKHRIKQNGWNCKCCSSPVNGNGLEVGIFEWTSIASQRQATAGRDRHKVSSFSALGRHLYLNQLTG